MPKYLIAFLVCTLAACGPTGTPPDNSATNGNTNSSPNNTTIATNGATDDGECHPLDPSIGPCDPLCQTGCEADQACSISSSDPFTPIQSVCEGGGPATAGMECSTDNGCEAGLGCLSIDGLTFECVPFCRVGGGVPGCDDETVCTPFDRDERRVGICIPPEDECTQYPGDDCPAGQNCNRTELGLRCIAFDPDASVGDDCTSPGDCNDDHGCINIDGRSQCRQLCDAADPMCADDEMCARLNDLPYGACVPGE
jgi:hypothetical protein